MKKIIAIVVAIVMMAAMAVPAFAGEIAATDANQTGKGTTNVTYTSSESFEVLIPADIALQVNDETGVGTSNDNEVSLTKIKLSADKTLTVTINGNTDGLVAGHNWRLKDDTTGGVIGYTITMADTANAENAPAIEQGATLIQQKSVKAFDGITKYLDLVTEETTQAGDFADVLTFTATVTSSLAA